MNWLPRARFFDRSVRGAQRDDGGKSRLETGFAEKPMRFAFASFARRPSDDGFLDTLRPATSCDRREVCPPGRTQRRSWTVALAEWLRGGWTPTPAVPRASRHVPPAASLDEVRRDFIDAVDDVRTPQAEDLLDRIRAARGLREFWHLRAEAFRLVSLHHSQSEADERLAWLNRHFPTRSARSGFGGLSSAHTSGSKDMWP